VLDRTTGNNGDVLHLTITTLRAGTVGKNGGLQPVRRALDREGQALTNIVGAVQN